MLILKAKLLCQQNVSLEVNSSNAGKNESSDTHGVSKFCQSFRHSCLKFICLVGCIVFNFLSLLLQDKTNSTVALFSSLSRSKAREEALLYGSFTFLPFNTSTNTSSNSYNSSSSQPMAFLRSWGCVHFLVVLNVGPEVHALDPAWYPSLPEHGVFVASTGMDRMGSTSLYTLELQPHEAVVIKF